MAGNEELGDPRQEPLPLSTVLARDRFHALITVSERERKPGNKKTVDVLLKQVLARESLTVFIV